MTAVSQILAYRARKGKITRSVREKKLPRADAPHSTASSVRAAAVQMRFEFVNDGAQYAEKIYALARQAVEQGAQLIAFPEYAWTPLLGMLPGIRDLEKHARGGLENAAAASGASLRDILRLVAPHVERAFVATGSAVARALNIYLMNGSTIARDDAGNLYNVAHLFAPDGSLLGAQKKLHPFTSEREWLTAGSELNVFDIGSTRVAAPVCMDFTYWETTRLAFQQGAEILLNPSADEFAEYEFLQARGVRTRVQEVPCYGILANMVTDLFGLHWRGPSMIVQPCALGNSILAQSQTTTQEEIVIAPLDLEKLRAYRAQQHWDFNPTLLDEILPRAYTAATQKRMR
jgi:predicted amidohydrolase